MSLLDLMKISATLDDDGVIPEEEIDDENNQSERDKYMDFYDDVKQPCKYIKEDW